MTAPTAIATPPGIAKAVLKTSSRSAPQPTRTSASSLKQTTIQTRGKWTGDRRTVAQIRHFDPILMDEPHAIGGTDLAPSPMEYFLAAFMGYTTVLIDIVAKERGFAFKYIAYELEATLNTLGFVSGDTQGVSGAYPHPDRITGIIKVSTDEDQGALLRLAEEVQHRSPIHNMLKAAGVVLDLDWIAVRR